MQCCARQHDFSSFLSHLLRVIVLEFLQLLRSVGLDGVQSHFDLAGLRGQLILATAAAKAAAVPDKDGVTEGR